MCLTKVKEKFLWVVRKLFTLLGFFSILGCRFFDFLVSKNIFNPCLYIEFNTKNPNPILKITICFTKTPKKPKHFRNKRKKIGKFQKSKSFKNPNFYFEFSTRSTIHNFYYFFWLITVFEQIHNFQKPKFLFCILYTFHNSYFLYIFLIFMAFIVFIVFIVLKKGKFQKLKFLFRIMYTFHNS